MSDKSAVTNASVLLAFRGANVRSFRDPFEMSLLSTSLSESAVVRRIPWREGGQPIGVLPAAGVFGANASGKSNILRAMNDMRSLVLSSFMRSSPIGGPPRRPFLLDGISQQLPSHFEVDLILSGVRHRYGFEIDDDRVIEEWAFRSPHGRSALLFHRVGLKVDLGGGNRSKGRAAAELLRPNALFLSTAAAGNHPALLPIYEWFARNLLFAEASSRPVRQALTAGFLDDPAFRDRVLALLGAADLGLTGAKTHELDPVIRERIERAVRILAGGEGGTIDGPEVPEFDAQRVTLVHRGVDRDVELDPDEESLGTLVWFGLIGPIIGALEHGAVLLADELDASLHPRLVAELVRLFQDSTSNPRRAQIIFNSHDASLLGGAVGERLLGRDQVWFTEKHEDGTTRLYPLSDLDPRKEEAIGRRYLEGRYGATPILSTPEFAAAGPQGL